MNAAIRLNRLDEAFQRGLHLLVLAVRQEMIEERMRVASSQLLNFLGGGGIAGLGLLRLRHIESLEKHCLQLLRRVQVEGVIPRQLTCSALLFVDLLNEGIALGFQDVLVHGNAGSLHTGQNGHQR